MRLTEIKGTNMDLTDAIKARIENRIGKMEKMCAGLEPCDIAADVGKTTKGQNKGKIFRAEFNMKVPGAFLRTESTEEDLYVAIDAAVRDLRRQVVSYRKKRNS